MLFVAGAVVFVLVLSDLLALGDRRRREV